MRIFTILLLLSATAVSANAQWVKQNVNTTANFRGLSVVNEKVVWASGTGGTVIKTADGGRTWNVMTVPGAEKLDFRDIEAFDTNTAYILSIGNGDISRIYKTVDGGKTWEEQFRNKNEKAFFDALACWDTSNCIAMSDPVESKFLLIETKNGGSTWTDIDTNKMPPANDGEAAFAASGTCLITKGKDNVFLVTGGNDARVFKSTDRGRSWNAYNTPIVKGTQGSGAFSINIFDKKNGVIVGGNYEKPSEAREVLALSTDGGETWTPRTGMSGYRSGVAYVDKKTIVAVGTNGSDISRDSGKTWTRSGSEDLNAVQANGKRAVWAVGPNGLVVKMK